MGNVDLLFSFHRFKPTLVVDQLPSHWCITAIRPAFQVSITFHLLPIGNVERGVLVVGSIPVAILPSCLDNYIGRQLPGCNVIRVKVDHPEWFTKTVLDSIHYKNLCFTSAKK